MGEASALYLEEGAPLYLKAKGHPEESKKNLKNKINK